MAEVYSLTYSTDWAFEWELETPEGKPHMWKCLCAPCREWLFAQPFEVDLG